MSDRTLYFAYGSNISQTQMEFRCPTAIPLETVSLQGYQLEFMTLHEGTPGFGTILPKESGSVPGILWSLRESDEKALDRYEGYPSTYVKVPVQVRDDNGEITEAMAYVMNPKRNPKLSTPSYYYYKIILDGYTEHGLDLQALDSAMERAWEAKAQSGLNKRKDGKTYER